MSQNTKTGEKKPEAPKELKKQDTQEDLPEDEIAPQPRRVVMLVDAYPEKMINLREDQERAAQEKEEKARKAAEEEEKKKKKPTEAGNAGQNKSNVAENKSQVQGSQAEEKKEKRKDSFDVKHLDNPEIEFKYEQVKNVLHIIPQADGKSQIREMIDFAEHGPHISFWVFFDAIKYDHPKNHVTFLTFGTSAAAKSLIFSLEKEERKEKDAKGGVKVRSNMVVKYIGSETGKVGRLIAECQIVPNKLYFVTLSSILNREANFTEFRLAINGKTEACQSANEGIRIDPDHVVVGSEVTSSAFTGLLSDLLILTIPFDLPKQKEFYENYWDYQNGSRGRELLDDQLVYAKVEEKYRQSGCPKELLKSYKYDESFKRTVQEKRNYKEVVETEQEIKAKTDKSKAAKLQREKREKKIKENVNSFIGELRATNTQYFGILRDFVNSRKWIFKSLNLYSPTIKKAGEPILPFPCAHNLLSKVKDLQVPFYVIEMEHFCKVLNMVRELNNEFKKLLVKFGDITDTLIEEKKMGPCIVYDRFLHYLCWADDLRPEGWQEKVEEDNEEEEEEDMSSSEEDPTTQVKEDKPKAPVTDFTENAFIGDKQGLKEKLKGFMHELNETAEEETGDIPKMYYENRRLHSFEVFHDAQRVQSLIFNYLVRLDEKTTWEEVMHDYEANGTDPTVVEEPGAKGKDDKSAPKGEGGKKVTPTLYKIEQVKCFQEKLPDEEGGKKDDKSKEDPKEGEAKKLRYKFADPKLLTRSIYRMHECNKLVFKTCDKKVFTIRIFKKDGTSYRLELQKNMSEEFQDKRQKRLDEIERAKQEQARQIEEEKQREKEKKEREQKERRERRENRKNKEVFVNTSQVEEEKPVEVKKVDIPELGEFEHVKYTWTPGTQATNFAMAIINEDNHLIGFGLYRNHHEAVKMHNPESLEEVPINNFRDVLKHHTKHPIKDSDQFRVRHLKFKYTKEKFLEVVVKVEKKLEGETQWFSDILDEKARLKREAELEEEKRKKEEEEKKAKQPGGGDPPKAEPPKPAAVKEEVKTQEEKDFEEAHLFEFDFVHEEIARQRRIEEIAQRRMNKVKAGDKNAKAGGKDAGGAAKAKDPKADDKAKGGDKGKAGKDKQEVKKEDLVQLMEIDLKKIQKLRVDHKYGQAYKLLFHYKDETVTTIEVPQFSEEKGKAFMAMVEEERKKKEVEFQKSLDDYNRELRKHDRAELRKKIQIRKTKGEVYTPVKFDKKKPEPKIEKDEEKRIIDQSIYYINDFKPIDGIFSIFSPELKYLRFWGPVFKVKKTEEEIQKEKEAEEKRKKEKEEQEKLAKLEEESGEKRKTPEELEAQRKAEERKEKEAHKLKDDFIRNYSLSRYGLKLIFFIDYHVTPQKDPTKHTITINDAKFKDDLFGKNFSNVSKFLKDMMPDCTIIPNYRKAAAIGLFRIYTYGFGENPEQEMEFFSNKQIKTPFPDVKDLYYALIDEFVRYEDLKKLENRQKEELMRLGINLPTDAKKTQNATVA